MKAPARKSSSFARDRHGDVGHTRCQGEQVIPGVDDYLKRLGEAADQATITHVRECVTLPEIPDDADQDQTLF